MNKLDSEEKEILAAYDSGTTASVPGVKKELARHRKVAESTFKKDARINIRIARSACLAKAGSGRGHTISNADRQYFT